MVSGLGGCPEHRAAQSAPHDVLLLGCQFGAVSLLDTTVSDNDASFAGNGASKQSNALDGAISVTVAKRFNNGNLLVRGQKWIAINSGKEFVRVQGIVRPSDIAPDNSVVSWKVADAYISYGGQGTVANASKPGWLFRFFNSPHTPF